MVESRRKSTCSSCCPDFCLAISRSCASWASNESHFLHASFRSVFNGTMHELMDGSGLFPPKLQLALHHELEARARLLNVKKSLRAQTSLGGATNLNRPQIVRGSHDVLCECRDPLHLALPLWGGRRRRIGRRGEKCT